MIFIYMLSYIDRANVGNARLFGAQEDTGKSLLDSLPQCHLSLKD